MSNTDVGFLTCLVCAFAFCLMMGSCEGGKADARQRAAAVAVPLGHPEVAKVIEEIR